MIRSSNTTVSLLILCAASASQADETPIDYVTEVRPILSAKCFFCHGPDEATREAGLRLDEAEAAYADLGGYAAIVPHTPDDSEVVYRIESDEDDYQMPPAESGKSLSAEEIETLKAWIAQGAEYQPHWAFERITRPELPTGPAEEGAIDRFVLRRLQSEGLSPAPPADRYTLARRVALDLTGLPPTAEEAAHFASDSSPDAYTRFVDRLLAKPTYGERWARHWLDLARYSDTKGYEKDRPRTMWPYRDWVIRAINDDMPFDRFTIEQLAGDMLPKPTSDQLVATGFHRNTMVNEEGGIDPEEYRYLAIVDRVNTTGATWLGLTVGCAQCHTHKYDPITHTDYYSMFALLNNADETQTALPDPNVAEEQEKIDRQIAELRGTFAQRYAQHAEATDSAPLAEAAAAWAEDRRESVVTWTPLAAASIETNLPLTELLSDASVLVSGDVTNADRYTLAFDPPNRNVSAIRIEAIPDARLPGSGSGRRTITDDDGSGLGGFLLTEIKVEIEGDSGRQVAVSEATATHVLPGLTPEMAIDGRPDTGWAMYRRQREPQSIVLQLEEPVELAEGERLVVTLCHDSFYPAGLGRFRISLADSERVAKADGLDAETVRAILTDGQERTATQVESIEQAFLYTTDVLKDEREELQRLIAARPNPLTALTLNERRADARTTHRRHRGEYLKPRETVAPATPHFLPPMPEGATADRLTLAKWLVSRENPLTARVIVNRHWEAFFGTGLVKTTADFGLQGEYPSHPELLDWLACELMDSGWSLKKLHRQIVLSDAYRQSTVNPEATRVDPENRLLARMSRVRLPAETIRDVVLETAGLLSDKLGGPSVFPPQPPGITEAAYGPLRWVVSEGEDRYRRGLYTFNKRTAPYVAFGLFDGPSGEVCVPRRDRSTTPLQALAMMNDTVVTEAARALATRLVGLPDDRAAERLLEGALSRPAAEDAISSVVRFVEQQRSRLDAEELVAARVLNIGPRFEWRFESDAEGWQPRNQSEIAVEDGLVVTATGGDPYIGIDVEGPAGEYKLELPTRVLEGDGPLQVFWTTENTPAESPAQSVTLMVETGEEQNHVATITAASPLRSLRIDTGGEGAKFVIKRVSLTYGDGLIDPETIDNPVELAAWSMAARAVMNLDEVITRP